MPSSTTAVGIDACSGGWFATIISESEVKTEFAESFSELHERYSDARRILVDIPIGLPTDSRRRCDEHASSLLGCRGISVFYPPCRSVIELDDYDAANEEHKAKMGKGLTQQAFAIRKKIREVASHLPANKYDGVVRESHPELSFYALNGQPIAYPKASQRGRNFRLNILDHELDNPREIYEQVREQYPLRTVDRDDIIDSMVLAVAAQSKLQTTSQEPESDEPRIYYPTPR